MGFNWFLESQKLFFNQTGKSVVLLTWMRQVLSQHCSFLLANPDLREQLQPLYKSLQERLQATEPLQRIQGKIELLLATAKERLATAPSEGIQEPLRTFEEGRTVEPDAVENSEEEENSDDSELNEDDLAALMDDDDFDPEEFL